MSSSNTKRSSLVVVIAHVGSILAGLHSYELNHDTIWAIFHSLFGWLYLGWLALGFGGGWHPLSW